MQRRICVHRQDTLQVIITDDEVIQVYIHFSSLFRAVSPSLSVCIKARMSSCKAGKLRRRPKSCTAFLSAPSQVPRLTEKSPHFSLKKIQSGSSSVLRTSVSQLYTGKQTWVNAVGRRKSYFWQGFTLRLLTPLMDSKPHLLST